MSERSLSTLDFHGATLVVERGPTPETTRVAMKPIVEGMGLDWSGQFKKIKDHPVLAEGVGVIAIPSEGGTQAMTALALNLLTFWLATVQTDRVKDLSARERIIAYQRECAAVLYNHFFGKAAEPDTLLGGTPQPFPNWPMEELRTKKGTADLYRMVYGPRAAQWVMPMLGFPPPPAGLIEVGRQSDLFSQENDPDGGDLLVAVRVPRRGGE